MLELDKQIKSARIETRTESYSLSWGEILNMFKDGDLILKPDYQRLYRWDLERKTRFIESLLLGIPIPALFVAADADARWEVIDGLQRMCTVLEFFGLLKDVDAEKEDVVRPPLVLAGTKFLPSLNGTWVGPDETSELVAVPQGAVNPLSTAQCRELRRARVKVEILLRESSPRSKYDLFQRLNTGGVQLTPQEIRDCIVVSVNTEFHQWLLTLRSNVEFSNACSLSENRTMKADLGDWVSRFVSLVPAEEDEIKAISDINAWLDDKMISYAERFESGSGEFPALQAAFRLTFAKLTSSLGANVFRRFNNADGAVKGQAVISSFEALAIGLGTGIYRRLLGGAPEADVQRALDLLNLCAPDDIRKRVEAETDFHVYSGMGKRASERMPRTIAVGRRLLALST